MLRPIRLSAARQDAGLPSSAAFKEPSRAFPANQQAEQVLCAAQLVHAYNKVCERNDQSLFHYGFVQDLDPPLLSALDTPNGNLYDAAEYTEADYGRSRQQWIIQQQQEACCQCACGSSCPVPKLILVRQGSEYIALSQIA